MAAYVYALTGTGAYTERFSSEIASSGIRVPLTADSSLFDAAVLLGQELLLATTQGDRNLSSKTPASPWAGQAKATSSIQGQGDPYPESFSYDPILERLTVGAGVVEPVPQQIWDYNVSGLNVISSWLGYRMSKRSGKAGSPLDRIRPTTWAFTRELLQVIKVVEMLVAAEPAAALLLDSIVDGPLLEPDTMHPAAAEQLVPPSAAKLGATDTIF